jgi:hypothetical protein
MQPIQSIIQWVPGIKARRLELTQTSYLQDEGQTVYTAIPSTFAQGEFYIHLLLKKKEVAGLGMRGYIKDRNLCVILDFHLALHCAASWMYQVLFLFITQINTNQYD